MMSTASIYNPENSPGRLVRRLSHHQVDKSIEGGNARIGSHSPEDLSAKDIPGRMVGHGPFALVFEFDPLFISRGCRQAGMAATQDLAWFKLD
jgi:hypothetical protein